MLEESLDPNLLDLSCHSLSLLQALHLCAVQETLRDLEPPLKKKDMDLHKWLQKMHRCQNVLESALSVGDLSSTLVKTLRYVHVDTCTRDSPMCKGPLTIFSKKFYL